MRFLEKGSGVKESRLQSTLLLCLEIQLDTFLSSIIRSAKVNVS
jgi:hypothetical protein